jgi:uncharacterized membrane protein YbhN (UPF0104 family)
MRLILKISVSLVLIGLVCTRLDWEAVARQFADQRPVWLMAAVFVVVGQITIAALRWRLVLRALGIAVSARSVFSVTYIASFFNCWLLGTMSGDVARAMLAPSGDSGRAVIVHSVVLDRVMTLCGLGAGVLPVLFIGAGPLAKREWMAAALVVALIPLAMLFLMAPVAEFVGALRMPWADRIRDVAHSWRRLMRARSRFGAALAWSVAASVAISVMAWCLGRAQHLEVPLVDFLVLMPPVVLLTALPISVGGWGVREGALVYALGAVGVGASAATVLSVEMGTLVALVSLPGGLLWLWQYRAGLRPEPVVQAPAASGLTNR